MNYSVEWLAQAEDDLAATWLAATDQNAVTAAADWLDRRLRRDPLKFGKPRRSSVHREGYYPPLGIEFEVIGDDKRVLVQAVWLVQ